MATRSGHPFALLAPSVCLLIVACQETPTSRVLGARGAGDVANELSQTINLNATGNGPPAPLAVGNFHGCGIVASGATWCWGAQTNGVLGNGALFGPPSAPVPVAGSPAFTTISSGGHTCGLLADGSALCWGRNNFGEIGDGTALNNRATPVMVRGGPWATISVGRLTTCALTPANEAYCWGINQRGELGNPSVEPCLRNSPIRCAPLPVPVTTSLRFANIAAGWQHTCAVTATAGPAGEAYCWGSGRSVGDGGTADQPTPVKVAGGLTFTRLFAGGNHTCGLTTRGAAYCWGVNGTGQLGDGSTTDRSSPTPVAGGHTFATLAAGTFSIQLFDLAKRSHTCGLLRTGQAYCWGANHLGQLGDGTTTDRLVPTAVSTTEVFVAIATGDNFTCAMTLARKVVCWGTNAAGELGNGTSGGFSTTPVAVPRPFG